ARDKRAREASEPAGCGRAVSVRLSSRSQLWPSKPACLQQLGELHLPINQTVPRIAEDYPFLFERRCSMDQLLKVMVRVGIFLGMIREMIEGEEQYHVDPHGIVKARDVNDGVTSTMRR